MTSCIDYCDKACQHRRLMATMLCRSSLCHYIFELAACKALGSGSMQRHFFAVKRAQNPARSIETARIHPWGRLAQLSISLAPILYELVACSLKHLSASISPTNEKRTAHACRCYSSSSPPTCTQN